MSVLGVDLLTGLAAEGVLDGLKYTSSDLAVLARLRASTPAEGCPTFGSVPRCPSAVRG